MGAWLGFDPVAYAPDEWIAHVMGLDVSKMSWKPIGVMLHATGLPTLGQWVEMGPAHDARLVNLEAYYQGMSWQHGPHAFVSRSHINGFSSLLDRGTHCSCVNFTHFGIEQAGNFNTGHDDYASGDGAMVRDCAAVAIAALMKKFSFDPDKLLPHASCRADGHFQCPGDLVSIPEMIARVKREMILIGAPGAPVTTAPSPPGPAPVAAPPVAAHAPLPLPTWPTSAADIFFTRAARALNKWVSLGVPARVAYGLIAQAEAETAFKLWLVGDKGTAFGLHQWHWVPRGAAILAATGIDVRIEPLLEKHIEGAYWELTHLYAKSWAKILAAPTAADAGAMLCTLWEGAGAADAAARRAQMAERWLTWFAANPDVIKNNPAQG